MSFIAIITITAAGVDAGPVFDIYSDVDGFTTPFENDVPKASLLSGFTSVNVPDGTTEIKLISDGVTCTNNVIVQLPTTTTTVPCYCYKVDTTGGSYAVEWVDCDGNQGLDYLADETTNFCAKEGSIQYTGTGDIVVTGGINECSRDFECYEVFKMFASGINKLNIRKIVTSVPFIVDWGDGNQTSYLGSTTNVGTHTYSSPFTGEVKILTASLAAITELRTDNINTFTVGTLTITGPEISKLVNLQQLYSITTILNADASELPDTLTRFTSYKGILTGDVADLPTTLTQLNLTSNEANILSGDVGDLPPNLTLCVISGNNTISGDIIDLPAGYATAMTRLVIQGKNTLTGDISVFSTYTVITEITIHGFNTIDGDIAAFSALAGLIKISILGWSSLSGDLSSLSGLPLVILSIDNDPFTTPPGYGNTITGDIADIPKTVYSTSIGGFNTIYGDLVDMPTGVGASPTTTIKFNVRGDAPGGNTITGNISSLAAIIPSIDEFTLQGANTVIGDIATLPAGIKQFSIDSSDLDCILTGDLGDTPTSLENIELRGNNTVTGYNGKIWSPIRMSQVSVMPVSAGNMPTPDIDQLLLDLSIKTWTYPPGYTALNFTLEINLRGTRSFTPAINAAVAALTAQSVVVTITP
jgi:hypothetical protein